MKAARKCAVDATGDAVTDLILDVFRLNGLLLTAGDRIVAWLARDMGANRQNVQRIVNDLQKAGLVTLTANPHHRRASLVLLTEKATAARIDQRFSEADRID